MNLVLFVFLLAGITNHVAAQSQQPETVTVSQAVQEAVEKNLNLLAERYNLNIADARIITAPYLPPRRYFAAPSVPGQQNSMRAEFERHRIATNFLRALAEQSGARHLQAASIENSERAFALIADELRNQYLLEYYSSNDQQDGGYRSITVRLKPNDLVVRARKGYRAPKAENRSIENQETKPPGQPRF